MQATELGVARNRGLSRSPPRLQTFVAGPRLQTLVAGLCVESAVFNRLVAGRVCRKTPDSVASLVAKRPRGPVTSPMFVSHCQFGSVERCRNKRSHRSAVRLATTAQFRVTARTDHSHSNIKPGHCTAAKFEARTQCSDTGVTRERRLLCHR